MSTLYAAYGSNMNIEQMSMRCPTAKKLGVGYLNGFKLVFGGRANNAVATIEAVKNTNTEISRVPIVLWSLESSDEAALDKYESVPHFYHKTTVSVIIKDTGETVECMVYIMNTGYSHGVPSGGYFDIILEGYRKNGIDCMAFADACFRAMDGIK